MLSSLCAASVVAVIMKRRKKKRKNRKTWTRDWLKTGPLSGHTTLSQQSSETTYSGAVKACQPILTHSQSSIRIQPQFQSPWWIFPPSCACVTLNSKTIVRRRSTRGNLLKGIDPSSFLFNNVQLPFNMLNGIFQLSI